MPYARPIIGPDGSLFGTTKAGGAFCSNGTPPGCGTVFNLKPPATVPFAVLAPWTETVLYSFTGAPDGAGPGYGDLIFDRLEISMVPQGREATAMAHVNMAAEALFTS